MLNVAILNDYSDIALKAADWSALPEGTNLEVFNRPMTEDEAAKALAPFEVIIPMRERMALPRSLMARLPRLRMILTIGPKLANLDYVAATELGILISPAPIRTVLDATPEFTWGLMIAVVRNLTQEDRRVRAGGWSDSLGLILAGRTLGLLGLGRIGRQMARYAKAFEMDVVAWSQNLTAEAAAEAGARLVSKDELFQLSQVVSIHVQLSDRTRGLVGARELGLMRPDAYLINTSRGPIVDEPALIAALTDRRIAGAGLDVFDQEPLPPGHPFRSLENVIATPHIGFNTIETYQGFYGEMPATIAAWTRGEEIPLINPEAAGKR